jgi:transposase
MISRGEDVEAQALRKRGWSISAIARHLGRDRGTIRAHLNGERQAGVRRRSQPDPLEPFKPYLAARFADNPHIWASALHDEVVALGYRGSYVSFARQVRLAGLRPHCEACAGVSGRETIEIPHPPGDETQWDWFERRAPWGGTANVLLGTLSHSGRVRGALAERTDQPHLVEAMDAVLRRLGGSTRIWRTDRLATVIVPGTADVQASFAPVAKHYGAIVDPCPARHGNRKGVVEAAVRYACGRWWRTMSATTPEAAQASLDRFCSTVADRRLRSLGRIIEPDGAGWGAASSRWPTVGELAELEPLLPLPPSPFPATVETTAPVAANASVAFRGNRYSVPPGLQGAELTLRHRLGSSMVEVHSPSGRLVVAHRLAPAGMGALVRTPEHRAALETAVLSSFTTARPCDRKGNYPPGEAARAEAARLLAGLGPEVVVDLDAYARLVEQAAEREVAP